MCSFPTAAITSRRGLGGFKQHVIIARFCRSDARQVQLALAESSYGGRGLSPSLAVLGRTGPGLVQVVAESSGLQVWS